MNVTSDRENEFCMRVEETKRKKEGWRIVNSMKTLVVWTVGGYGLMWAKVWFWWLL